MLNNIEVRLNVNYLKEKDEYNKIAKHIIYTGPIDAYYDYCYGALEYRTVRFETEILDETNHQDNAVINYTEYEVPYTRIIEHTHFEFDTTSPKTIISKEYSKTWEKGDEPYYPVNDEKNNELYNKYKESNIHFGGRLGSYKYYDMDKVILEALNYVNSIK